jgi:hypothetical protein
MNFQEFCDSVEYIDKQKVEVKNSSVLIYTNEEGAYFNVCPDDLVLFIVFLSKHFDEAYAAWDKTPTKKSNFTIYEEKSYRAIYTCTGEDEGLRTLKSAGRSQTRALSKVVSKLISFISGLEYLGVDNNTYFDKDIVLEVVKKIPDILILPEFDIDTGAVRINNKQVYIEWLKEQGATSSTIKKYTEQSINAANLVIRRSDLDFQGLYTINHSSELQSKINILNDDEEWIAKNASGKNMYSAGVNKYNAFLIQKNHTAYVTLSKQFIILAGISGSGKTRFVREQAKHFDSSRNNYCLTSVRPDWHEPSDLLGYTSYMSGSAEFISTDILRFLVSAWKHIIFKVNKNEDSLFWQGRPLSEIQPYFLCLDEMNLAPVEQYFSDYLSVLETQRWNNDFEIEEFNSSNKLNYKYVYECDPLIKASVFTQLDDNARNRLASNLGLNLEVEIEKDIWNYFISYGISIPFNLILAGTVNMDETTHGFSRKVLDRAITLDFGEFYPNDFSSYFVPSMKNNILTYPKLTDGRNLRKLNQTIDSDGMRTIEFITTINSVLKDSPFMLAYRALNELLLSVIAIAPKDERALLATWDDFVMTKILPRIEGDHDKLTGSGGDNNLLEGLKHVLKDQLNIIWEGSSRPDLYRSYNTPRILPEIMGESDNRVSDVVWITCRSKNKLEWMLKRLEYSAFTSFWP